MKRLASGVLCVAIVLCTLAFIPIKAEATTSGITGSCTWSLDGTVLTISGSGQMASYYTNGYLTNAPWSNDVTHVIIENGVTNVGQYAFYGCSKLQSVSLPSSVKRIDNQAFDRSGISSIKLSEGLTTIYNGAFNSCTSLHRVVLPKSLTYIGDWAFQSCPITSIVFSTNLKYIGNSAFNYGSITDVWYLGNQSDKAGMTIKGYNACLNTATWHYDSCPIGAPHSYDNECDANCNGCGLSRIVPEHIYDNTCDPACNVCGETRAIEHQYNDACDTKCNICQTERVVSHSYDSGKVTQNATCGALGVKTFTCTVCGATKTEDVDKTSDHQYGKWNQVSDMQHKHTCSICAKEETADHIWDGGKVTKQPSCNEVGVKTYTCFDCGGTKSEDIAKSNDHKYGSWTEVNDAQHKHICFICSKEEKVKHTWNSGTITKKATCKETGIKTYTCIVCGGTKSETVPKLLDHTYDNDCDLICNVCSTTRTVTHKYTNNWSKDETNHWYECSECGYKKNASKHTPSAEPIETATQKCTICDYIIKPALTHTHKFAAEWTTDKNGHWYACSGCEEKSCFAVHAFENACDTDCSICGFERKTSHSFTLEYKSDVINHWYVCSVCGEKDDVKVHEPGPAAAATTAQVCSICGYEITPALEEIEKPTDAITESTDAAPTETTTSTNETDVSISRNETSFPWWVIVIGIFGVTISIVAIIVLKRKMQ